MADPNKYIPGYSFSGFQASNPANALPAPDLDNELFDISQSIEQIVSAIKDVRRSDGKLQAGSITVDSVTPAALRVIGDAVNAQAHSDLISSVTAAESARDIAIEAAGQSFSGFSSKAVAVSTSVPSSVQYLRLAGYFFAGDGGNALYRKISTPLSVKAWQFRTADGAWWELSETLPNVRQFGARADGIEDTVAFTTSLTMGRPIVVPPGTYNLTSNVSGLFVIERGVRFSGPGRAIATAAGFFTDLSGGADVKYLPERVFVGAATTHAGDTSFGPSNTYAVDIGVDYLIDGASFASFSPFGGVGSTGGTRASDSYKVQGDNPTLWASGAAAVLGQKIAWGGIVYSVSVAGSLGSTPPSHTSGLATNGTAGLTFAYFTNTTPIGLSGFAVADINDGRGAWAGYLEVNRTAAGGTAFGLELVAKNKGPTNPNATPANALPGGATIGLWLPGGGDAVTGAPTNPSTVAIVIGKSATTWNKGIVFAADALTDFGAGSTTAIELGARQQIQWTDTAGAAKGFVRSDTTTAGRGFGAVFSDTYATVINKRSTGVEDSVVRFRQHANTTANKNWIELGGSDVGAAPGIYASGSDTHVDLILGPQNGGVVKIGYAMQAQNTPSSFSASHALVLKDSSGAVYYVPCRTTGW